MLIRVFSEAAYITMTHLINQDTFFSFNMMFYFLLLIIIKQICINTCDLALVSDPDQMVLIMSPQTNISRRSLKYQRYMLDFKV